VRALAGQPKPGQPGRVLPKFNREWRDVFEAGHLRRIKMWETANEAAGRRGGCVCAIPEKAKL